MTQALSRSAAATYVALMSAASFFVIAKSASAQDIEGFFPEGSEEFQTSTGLGNATLQETIGSIIRVALGFLGIIAVVIILFGGFKWMTAGGKDDQVKDAKKLMISGVIGLVIVLAAFAIAQFIVGQLADATGAQGNNTP